MDPSPRVVNTPWAELLGASSRRSLIALAHYHGLRFSDAGGKAEFALWLAGRLLERPWGAYISTRLNSHDLAWMCCEK